MEDEKKEEIEEKVEEKEELELDEEATKAIASQVAKGMEKTISDSVAKAMAEKAEADEKTINKNVNAGADEEEETKDGLEKESKELRFVKSAIALIREDRKTLTKYNKFTMGLRAKTGYANSDTDADGGYILADPEFEAAVEKLADNYGVVFGEADVRPITSNSVKTNKRGSNVTMYETGEGVAKTGTKLTISQVTAELRKFAAIAVATDELTEDAAIDFWNEVAQGFAEERARIADELVFTDTNATYPGIFHTDGVHAETVGSSITSITWDDLMDAESRVPTNAAKNGKHYMHRSIWNILRKQKASDSGVYHFQPTSLRDGLTTPWGVPVVLVDALPSASQDTDDEPFTVFGDLKRAKLYVKRGLVLEKSNQATVTDSESNEVNLFEQDMTALRAVTRMVCLVKFPEAFCIIGTGTVS